MNENNVKQNKYDKFLPIGTVCLLKGATKKIMITGYLIKGEEGTTKTYDYCGCMYPEGVISSKQNLLFNHEDIEDLFFIGYADADYKLFNNKLKTIENKVKANS